MYGSRVFVRVPEIKRRSKWDRKADLGVLVGYENVGYIILINNRVIVAKQVNIVEENVKLVGFSGNDENSDNELIENEINQNTQNQKVGSEFDESNEINENENIENKEYENSVPSTSKENLKVVRRCQRKKSPINRYRNPIKNCIYVNYASVDKPQTILMR